MLRGARADVLRDRVVVLADIGYEERPTMVAFSVDGRVRAMRNTGPYRFEWDTREAADGTHTLGVEIYAGFTTPAAAQELTVAVENR